MKKRESAVERLIAKNGEGELGREVTRNEFKGLVSEAEVLFAKLTRNRKTSQLYWIAGELVQKYPKIFTKKPHIGSVRNYLKELSIKAQIPTQ